MIRGLAEEEEEEEGRRNRWEGEDHGLVLLAKQRRAGGSAEQSGIEAARVAVGRTQRQLSPRSVRGHFGSGGVRLAACGCDALAGARISVLVVR